MLTAGQMPSEGDGPITDLHLTLYIAGAATHRSVGAKRRLDGLADRLGVDVRIDVVDVLEDPARAERHAVFATPTLVREAAPPSGQRVVGDLSAVDEVARALGLGALLRDRGLTG